MVRNGEKSLDLARKRILIVDDEQDLRETLADFLQMSGAYAVCASDGNEAFNIINKGGIDLVVCDIKMPECSGIELLHKVRASNEKTPPIIMMSGFTDFSEKDVLDLGAKAMFMKPQTLTKLKELILEVLS